MSHAWSSASPCCCSFRRCPSDSARVYPAYIDPAWINILPYYSQMGANPTTNYGAYWTIFGGYLLKCGYTSSIVDPLQGLSKVLIGADVRAFFRNIYYGDPTGNVYNASAIIDQAHFDIYCHESRKGQQAPIVLEYPTGNWAQ